MADDIVIKPVRAGSDRMAFARLPRLVYAGRSGFAPGLDLQLRNQFDRRKNPYFEHAEGDFFLALRNGQAVGRISAQVDRLEAERGRAGLGHFGCLVAIDDLAVVQTLLGTAETWLAERGATEITGPFDMSINGEAGLLVDGFEERPHLMSPWAPPYLPGLLERAGYRKLMDMISYDLRITGAPIAAAVRFMADHRVRETVRVRAADLRQFAAETDLIRDIFNDAWSDNWGFVPVTEKEMRAVAQQLKPVLPAEAVVFVEVAGRTEAFALAMPNLVEVTADLGGRLLPFGWAKLAWRIWRKRYTSARVILMGVRKAHQRTAFGAGLALTAIEELRLRAVRHGITSAELGWVLENNLQTRRIMDLIGARAYKSHRIFERQGA